MYKGKTKWIPSSFFGYVESINKKNPENCINGYRDQNTRKLWDYFFTKIATTIKLHTGHS